jgi:hypothetical protein
MFSDSSFLARLIETTAEKMFAGDSESEVDINVPEEMAVEIKQHINKETAKALSSRITLNPSGSMEKGFEIIPHGKGYKIRITESDFNDYIKGFLRSRLIDLLFEQEK